MPATPVRAGHRERRITAGLSPLGAARGAELEGFAAWPDAERIVLNLQRAYAEAGKGELDLMAAFADAVTWNGGPLHCAV
jgi:cyclase